MLFSSVAFIFYFLPIAVAGYFLLRFSIRAQNLWLVGVSLFFYAWGEPFFVLVLIASVAFNHFLALSIERARDGKRNTRHLVVVGCVCNLGLLFCYKYLAFLVASVGGLFGFDEVLPFGAIPLPIGISFFTFRSLSYIIDTARGDVRAQRSLVNTACYATMFPQLVAGPIMQYADIESQLTERTVTWEKASVGLCRFIVGLAKKVLIANSVAPIATHVFNYSAMSRDITNVPVTLAWLGVAAYMIQIYFDFSGYSDMAIGLAALFGFELAENFNYPYIATSISDFWSRWHISLYRWFRNYVYFPLGGSRVRSKDLMVRNLFIVWLLTGIWHGAGWNYLLWGMWQFIFIVLERVTDFDNLKIPRFVRRVYMLLVTMFGFVIFRASDIYQVTLYYGNMLGLNNNGFFSDTALMFLREFWVFLLAGVILSAPIARWVSERLKRAAPRSPGRTLAAVGYPAALMAVFFLTLAYLMMGTYNPFIYFNF